jgi:hypothetical protein
MFIRRSQTTISQYRGYQRQRFSLLLLSGMLVPVVMVLTMATIFVLPKAQTHAADDNVNCTLIVPPNPLTAQGLATPYQLKATDSGRCKEANPVQAAFVQAAVIDPTTGKISIYNPLVINKGSKPAAAPVVPVLPQGAVVGIWFGFNGNTLTLEDSENSLQNGNCVNGVGDSVFGQFSYCNAPAFFQAANQAIQSGKLVPPALGTAKDGMPCPTTRDFSIVDQDQSDNLTTAYLISAKGRVAQDTTANAAALQGQGMIQKNASDEGLLIAVDNAIGCTPWMAPDLADPGKMVPALPLNELQAAAQQKAPTGLVPSGDPMVLKNGETNLKKLNAYRVGVDQPTVQSLRDANTKTYCKNLLAAAPQRIFLDANLTKAQPSPDPAAANSLFTFLAQRFVTTYEENGLNCMKLLDQRDPIKVKTNGDGVAVDARLRSDDGSDDGNDN